VTKLVIASWPYSQKIGPKIPAGDKHSTKAFEAWFTGEGEAGSNLSRSFEEVQVVEEQPELKLI
jgi:hypothetical protein